MMANTRPLRVLRDVAAVGVVLLFLFPIAVVVLTSFKPDSAIYNKDGFVFFDFAPTLGNYSLSLFEFALDAASAKQAFVDSILIAAGSTVTSVLLGLLGAFGFSRIGARSGRVFLVTVMFFRILPPMTIALPVVLLYNAVGLFNTRIGVALMHTVANLPIALLLLKSFMDDVPREVDDAARLDGASNWQILFRIIVPVIRGGIGATAILCFIFSWTEFLMSLFLTVSFRTLPVMISVLNGGQPGPVMALCTITMLPALIAILFVQRSLVRGMTLGMQR
jgi:multiple sugar transport system permease protein